MKYIKKFFQYIYDSIYYSYKWGNLDSLINWRKILKRKIKKWIFIYKVSRYYYAGWELCDWVFWANGYAIIDYVENGGIEQINWYWDEVYAVAYKKIIECYAYFKYQIHSSEKLEEYYLHEWSKENKHWYTNCDEHPGFSEWHSENTPLGEIYWNILKDLEAQHEKTKEEMLYKVIEVRNFLWS